MAISEIDELIKQAEDTVADCDNAESTLIKTNDPAIANETILNVCKSISETNVLISGVLASTNRKLENIKERETKTTIAVHALNSKVDKLNSLDSEYDSAFNRFKTGFNFELDKVQSDMMKKTRNTCGKCIAICCCAMVAMLLICLVVIAIQIATNFATNLVSQHWNEIMISIVICVIVGILIWIKHSG